MDKKSFFSIYSQGFFRCAAAIPETVLSCPQGNLENHLKLIEEASEQSVALVVFPELGLSGYSNEDLFHQQALIESSKEKLIELAHKTRNLFPVIMVGIPIEQNGLLYNCAAVIHRGKILGIIPKTYLPNQREFYEKRQFASSTQSFHSSIKIGENEIPFGTNLLFCCKEIPQAILTAEICEDLWAPISPAAKATLAGATIVANLSASNIVIGKAEYRRTISKAFSGKCICAYVYAAAGKGESTTDLAWDGHGMLVENGKLLKETKRFSNEPGLIIQDIDVEKLTQERLRVTNFRDSIAIYKNDLQNFRRIEFSLENIPESLRLCRSIERFPYVPSNQHERNERCSEAYNIQVHGLIKRLEQADISRIVIGVSGGLDSTHALIVACKAFDKLKISRKNILAYTLPGFATSDKTYHNANALMESLGVTKGEIDIKPSCDQMLKDINHPFAKGEEVFDLTFENVQAGDRTSHLFRLANMHKAIVLGTGDLSELALGWCTYGVGDHMSHYNVNASVPKTLIQYLIRWVAQSDEFSEMVNETLLSVLNTEISPELIPGDKDESPAQKTEDFVGPYELQDFNLYYITRYGFRPSKVAYLAFCAWSDKTAGNWLEDIPENKRNEYSLGKIKKWLEIFIKKFFGTTQFKRSCVPNGPKVGSGGSLSPRGDWRAPSDSSPAIWLDELNKHIP
jgi:NAD+ synthase (glutamine-hydrolysing)